MEKLDVLAKYFVGEVRDFRGQQELAIDAVLAGERVLCLMPTGEGKSLIYQVSGLCLGRSTIIISPLVALMKQQHDYLIAKGLKSLFLSELDYKQQFKQLTAIAQGNVPDFVFISPERAANDGYLEFVLTMVKDKVGLVVVDEAHCISQWGDGFRPAYKAIPDFLNRVFGPEGWPRLLCLTATLNDDDRKQVENDFSITKTIVSPCLWRKNLNLSFLNLGSGKDESKDEALERILDSHRGEKILVFVHRKYGNRGTTRTMFEKYSQEYPDCDYFDADIKDADKDRVLLGFKDGSIKIVFATSAFGMGVDIPDIRVVVHYLISESIEQYYQEVGRAGRDGRPAYGYLLYTDQSRAGRKRLIQASLCTEKTLRDECDTRQLKPGDPFGSIPYDQISEERRTALALLVEYGVVRILAKGVQGFSPFKAKGHDGEQFLSDIKNAAPTLLTKIVCKRKAKPVGSIASETWAMCAKGQLSLTSAPVKAMFYGTAQALDDDMMSTIMADQNAKLQKRMSAFQAFVDAIEDGLSPEHIVKSTLNIP